MASASLALCAIRREHSLITHLDYRPITGAHSLVNRVSPTVTDGQIAAYHNALRGEVSIDLQAACMHRASGVRERHQGHQQKCTEAFGIIEARVRSAARFFHRHVIRLQGQLEL
ncbi:hypothetical protein D4A92_23515 (plasmid) [Rhizobium rosettiformans]|uniref:Uncharacterized protein n=1 Tax=Rhizobium rosettiformans TaxID=1368430 RepID=A0ABX7F2F4_9HYPH|nr:hypothetical protein [Rhizobium rosettiformans]QRF54476.1 hypothetical protein D4A92_23515 [Rhizobium rosettiformans]